MTTAQAKKIIQNPDRVFVLCALSFVNLYDKEADILILRHMRGHTQEETAREMDMSVNGVQNIEKAALKKCAAVWENNVFVKSAISDAAL